MSRREFILLLAVGVDTAAWKTVKTWRDGITKLPADDHTRLIIEGLRGSYATKDFASPAAAKTAVVAGFRKTISAFGRLRTCKPKATLSHTVMWRKAA